MNDLLPDDDKLGAPDDEESALPVLVPDEYDAEENEGGGRTPIDLDAAIGDVASLNKLIQQAYQTSAKKKNGAGAAPAADEKHEHRKRGQHRQQPETAADVAAHAAADSAAQAAANAAAQSAAEHAEAATRFAEREAELLAQIEKEKNNTLRAVADLHNFRRRSEENERRIKANANERLIKDLLPVVDDFERGLAAAKQTESYEQLVEGVEAVVRKIADTLAKEGVIPIPAVGEKFDPDYHDAVMVDENSDQPDETITEEFRKGYTMHDRVIRPALVKVAKAQS